MIQRSAGLIPPVVLLGHALSCEPAYGSGLYTLLQKHSTPKPNPPQPVHQAVAVRLSLTASATSYLFSTCPYPLSSPAAVPAAAAAALPAAFNQSNQSKTLPAKYTAQLYRAKILAVRSCWMLHEGKIARLRANDRLTGQREREQTTKERSGPTALPDLILQTQ
jgi:hypothetical protein